MDESKIMSLCVPECERADKRTMGTLHLIFIKLINVLLCCDLLSKSYAAQQYKYPVAIK